MEALRTSSCVTKVSHRNNKRTKAVSSKETGNRNKYFPTLSLENTDLKIYERRVGFIEVFDHFKQCSIAHILVNYLSDLSGCCLLVPNIGTSEPSAYCRALCEIGWGLRTPLHHLSCNLVYNHPNRSKLLFLVCHKRCWSSRNRLIEWEQEVKP